MHTHLLTYISTWTHAHICIYTYICILIYIYTCIHVYMFIFTHTHTHIHRDTDRDKAKTRHSASGSRSSGSGSRAARLFESARVERLRIQVGWFRVQEGRGFWALRIWPIRPLTFHKSRFHTSSGPLASAVGATRVFQAASLEFPANPAEA